MNEDVKIDQTATPMLFPFEPAHFWQRLRQIIREEIAQAMEKHIIAVLSKISSGQGKLSIPALLVKSHILAKFTLPQL